MFSRKNLIFINSIIIYTKCLNTGFVISVGGIYTVIRSKAFVSTEEMGEQYCLLGPYKENYARTAVEELEFEGGSPYHTAVTKMRDQGFKVTVINDFAVHTYFIVIYLNI